MGLNRLTNVPPDSHCGTVKAYFLNSPLSRNFLEFMAAAHLQRQTAKGPGAVFSGGSVSIGSVVNTDCER